MKLFDHISTRLEDVHTVVEVQISDEFVAFTFAHIKLGKVEIRLLFADQWFKYQCSLCSLALVGY